MRKVNNIQDNQEENFHNPELSSVRRENPFDVPERYFEKLSMEIMEKCAQCEKKSRWEEFKCFIYSLLKPRAAMIVASFFILVVVSLYVIGPRGRGYNSPDFTGITLEDLAENDVIGAEYFDEPMLIETFVSENQFADGREDEMYSMPEAGSIPEQEIIDYLVSTDYENEIYYNI